VTKSVGLTPAVAKFLAVKSNGDTVVEVKSETLGLKSNVSDALKVPALGISVLYLSAV